MLYMCSGEGKTSNYAGLAAGRWLIARFQKGFKTSLKWMETSYRKDFENLEFMNYLYYWCKIWQNCENILVTNTYIGLLRK